MVLTGNTTAAAAGNLVSFGSTVDGTTAGTESLTVNGAGGVVSEVDTSALTVLRSNIDLAPVATTLTTAPVHPAALSADGTRIYAAGEHGVIVIYTGDLSVHSRYLSDRLVDSVALSDDGQRLYLASGGTISKVEAATGRPLETLASVSGALGLLAVGSH